MNKSDRTLEHFCQSHSSFKTKIALFTFYKANFSEWTNKILLIFEYLQLLSQVILLPTTNYDSPAYYDYPFRIIVYFFKLVNPGYLLTFDDGMDSFIFGVLVIVFWAFLLKISLFVYILCVSFYDLQKHSWLIFVWKWVFKLQTRILYFLFTSFWVRAMTESLDGHKATPINETALACISGIIIFAEFVFSCLIETQLCYVLPNKDFLSSKNCHLQMITLVQKFITHILLIIFRSDSEANAWVISLISLALSLVRIHHYYQALPLYWMKALLLQGDMAWIMMSLNIAYLVNTILRSADSSRAGINFMISAWIVLSLLASKMSRQIMSRVLMKLLCGKADYGSAEFLLHRITATKQLKENEKKPARLSEKSSFSHLISINQNVNLEEIFGCIGSIEGEATKEELKKIYMVYCENLAKRFPLNTLVKLNLTKLCRKSSEHYATTIKIASEIESNRWSRYSVTASLILFEMEKVLLNNQGQGELDFGKFIRNKVQVERLKKEILKQTSLYNQVFSNILEEVSDIGEIYNSGQLIGDSKVTTRKMAEKLFRELPDYYMSPYLLYAEYHLILNYSLVDFDKNMKIFVQRYFKNERHFKDMNLVEENLHEDSNAFLILSNQKNEAGKILFCTKSLQYLCGNTIMNAYVGSHVWNLFPPTFRAHYEELYKQKFSENLNKVQRGFISHRNRYLVEVDFCLKYHPYLHQNMCLNMIIRPVPGGAKDFLLVTRDGSIEGASEELARFFESKEGFGNIGMLSKELLLIFHAYKIVETGGRGGERKLSENFTSLNYNNPTTPRMLKNNSSAMGYQEAYEVYSEFIRNDRIIEILAFHEKNKTKSSQFYCNFSTVSDDNNSVMTLKITLQRVSSHREEYPSSEPDLNGINEQPSENIILDEPNPVTLDSYRKAPFRFPLDTLTSPVSNRQTEAPLLSLMYSETRNLGSDTLQTMTNRHGYNSERKHILSASHKKDTFPIIQRGEQRENDSEEMTEKTMKMKNLYERDKIQKYLSSPSSSYQQNSTEKAANKAYRTALNSKSIPKSFIILCLIFYGVILFTLVTQGILKIVSDDTLNDLQIKKDVLRSVQERSYRAILAQTNAISGAAQIQGALASNAAIGGLNVVAENLNKHAKVIKETNDHMLEGCYVLGKEVQDLLFDLNVNMHGTYLDSDGSISKKMTNFEASKQLINAMRFFADLDDWVSSEGYNSLDYITKNVLNEFVYESARIAQALTDSLENQKKSYENITLVCIILTPLMLVGIAVLLIVIVFNQYKIELKQMYALIRVRSPAMKEIAERIKKFQKSLINEEDHGTHNWFRNLSEDLTIINSLQIEQHISGYSKGEDMRKIKYSKFQRRYYRYFARVILCFSVLIAINIWDWVSTTEGNKVIYNRLHQVQYALYLNNRISVTYGAFPILFLTNNTLLVEHKKSLQAMIDGAEKTKTIMNRIISEFKEIDGEYNPAVKTIIFENDPSCYGATDSTKTQCDVLINAGQPTNLLSGITAFQSLIKNKYQDYILVRNGTESAIRTAAYKNILTLLPSFYIIAFESQLIADIIDRSLEQKVQDIRDNRTGILTVFALSLLVASAMIWVYILKHIREVYNDFKKVLQILPPGVVLSSYLLKKFLISTSSSGSSYLL